MIEQSATVYRQHGEKSKHSLRAVVDPGCPDAGLRVSCSYAARDSWQPGQKLRVVGRRVEPNGAEPYFKASSVSQEGTICQD